jgi:hypothetical protein
MRVTIKHVHPHAILSKYRAHYPLPIMVTVIMVHVIMSLCHYVVGSGVVG